MATEPVLSGEIPEGGVLEILRDIEARRITGKVRFVIGDETGEVELVAGQIAMDQDPLPNGSDPVEALLQARSGIFAVHAVLPSLPVSQGTDHERRGSLAVHVPADLMSYCENAGLTGVLEMRNEGRVVEVLYEAGEMLGIRLDGREDADLGAVFAWDQGSFRIFAKTEEDVRSRLPPPLPEGHAPPSVPPSARAPEPSAAPEVPEDPADREPTVRYARPTPPIAAPPDGGATSRYAKVDPSTGREDTGKNFLRVIEMALTDVVSVREKARASVRSAPPPKARPSVRPAARPARPKDTTVRIVWIGGEPSIEQAIPAAAREVAARPAPKPGPKPPSAAEPACEPAKASEGATKASDAAEKAPGPVAEAPELPANDTPAAERPARSSERSRAEREEARAVVAPPTEPAQTSSALVALAVAVVLVLGLLAWMMLHG